VKEQTGSSERGIPRVKMKVAKTSGVRGRVQSGGWRCAQAWGDDVEIFVDAKNGTYNASRPRDSKRLNQFNVRWFESRVLARRISGPRRDLPCNEPSPLSPASKYHAPQYGFKDLISHVGGRLVQPDGGRVGGVTEWMRWRHLAHALAHMPVARTPSLVHIHLALCHTEPAGGWVSRRLGGDARASTPSFPHRGTGCGSPYLTARVWARAQPEGGGAYRV